MATRISSEQREYARQIYHEVLDSAEAQDDESYLEESFTGLVLDTLEEDGYWPDYEPAHYLQRGLGLSAWGLDPTRRVLYLSITEFANSDEAASLAFKGREAIYKRLSNFFLKCRDGGIETAEHNPVTEAVETISDGGSFDEIRLFLITNLVCGLEEPEMIDLAGFPTSFRTFELETIRRARETGLELEPINIDLVRRFGSGVTCLRGAPGLPNVETYLLFLPGAHLADLYQEYGGRLLERNVRSFLMARTLVNRGIRETLSNEPERFLAYNNGLTATATRVTIDESDTTPVIESISDLQIVNGGQTTASVSVAARDPAVDIDKVFVQVKLAVVDSELMDDLVPNIALYANRQNVVQVSDLSANHPHLRNLQKASDTEWTPVEAGGRPTRWYFERARGSYNVEKGRQGSAANQREWVRKHPTKQKFGKNDLAVYENTWNLMPHLVSRGGQKNFTEYLLRLEDTEDLGTEEYRRIFQRLVAKAILFKQADRDVLKALGGTYKRPVVTYTIAHYLRKTGGGIDLDQIWRTQQLDQDTRHDLLRVADPLKKELVDSAAGRNITEWAKQEECWEHLQSCDFGAPTSRPPARSPKVGQSAKPSAAPKGKPARPAYEHELNLYECTRAVLGRQITEGWRRFSKKGWRHLGDTGVPASGDRTYHAFRRDWVQSDGEQRTDEIIVNPASNMGLDPIRLEPETREQYLAWLESIENGDPGA